MREPPDISVLILLYRGRGTIRGCLESLGAQRGVKLEVLLLDNGCPENTGEWAGYWLARREDDINWRLLERPRNIGFASGMNHLYAESSGRFVCFLNQDVTLAPDHLRLLYDGLLDHTDWAGACGTLYRGVKDESQRVLDTTGHVIFRDRIVRNRGGGRPLGASEEAPYPAGEVFGLSAACALYRRDALEQAREEEGPFDPDFFAYFEDIDLDYRIHRAGWKLGYIPEAVGWHTLAGSGARRELYVRLRAYGNRRRILCKHESLASLAPDLIPVLLQDTYAVLRALVTDPIACLLGPWFFVFSLPRVLRRRRRMDRMWGADRTWIRKWLRPETERLVKY